MSPRDNGWNHLYRKIIKITSQAKGYNSMTHYNLVHKFIPMPQAMKIPEAKAAVDKEWKKLETSPAWQLDKVRSKKEVILEAQRDKKQVHFATFDGHLSSQKCGVTTKISEEKKVESYSEVTL